MSKDVWEDKPGQGGRGGADHPSDRERRRKWEAIELSYDPP